MNKRNKILFVSIVIAILFTTGFIVYFIDSYDSYDGPYYDVEGKPLRYYGDKLGIDIGTAIHHYTWKLSDDRELYSNVSASQYNQLSYEYVISMDAMWLGPNEYNFKWADEIAQFAVDNNQTLRGDHLVWYDTIPDWIKSSKYSSSEVESMIKTYVFDVMRHFKDKFPGVITEWNAVNEVINNDDSIPDLYREGFLVDKLGVDWVIKVFQWAREADPDAKLILNEYDMFGVEEDIGVKVDKTYNVVEMLNSLGLIDGVGFQGHLSLKYENDWKYNAEVMKKFTDLGLTVSITELDVQIYNIDTDKTKDELLQIQAEIYVEVFKECLDNDLCTGITTWGFTDKYHYRNRQKRNLVDRPLIFDEHYNPKPAFYAIQQLLESRLLISENYQ